MVEYDSDMGNRWVLYPMSYTAFQELARAAGFTEPVLLGGEAITVAGADLCRLISDLPQSTRSLIELISTCRDLAPRIMRIGWIRIAMLALSKVL